MSDVPTAGGGRDVRKDGVQLVCPCYIEVRNWLNAYFAARAYHREAAGRAITAGEKKGAGLALANVICWVATLNDADLERIQEEGEAERARLDALPPSYGKTAGRVDPVTIVRRPASVLVAAGDPVVAIEAAADPVGPIAPAEGVKSLGAVRHPPGHRPKRQDKAGNPDGIKGAVR